MDFRDYIGLHIRLKESILQAAIEAHELGLKTFQFFLSLNQKDSHNSYVTITAEDKKKFIELSKNHFSDIYIHTSYWINPASGKKASYDAAGSLLKKEIRIAQELELNKLVLHPGSATGYLPTPTDTTCKEEGIDAVARMLNSIIKAESDIIIILENTAHGNRAIGSDLTDFPRIKAKLNHPEKVRFCIDFAHAFGYGYDLEDADAFIGLVDSTLGLANLELIHFNDSQEKFGGKKDKHAYPGYGMIGKKVLKSYLHHDSLKKVNKILELPQSSSENLRTVIDELCAW